MRAGQIVAIEVAEQGNRRGSAGQRALDIAGRVADHHGALRGLPGS